MIKEDIIKIICQLQHFLTDMPEVTMTFNHELSDRRYQIRFSRTRDKFSYFQIFDMGGVKDENT
jgi:hypothetical protein